MAQVIFFRQDHARCGNPFTEQWDMPRTQVATFTTPLEGEAAAEQCFHIFNAPHELLNDFEKNIAETNRGPSMSVGDIAQVDGVPYLCCSYGWRKYIP